MAGAVRSVRKVCGAHLASHLVGTWGSVPYDEAAEGVKLTDYSPPSTAEVSNEWGCAWTALYVFIVWCLIKHTCNVTFLADSHEIGLCDLHAVCMSVINPPHIHFSMPEPIFMKFGMYIMAPESISAAYFINSSLHSCVCMCIPSIVARQRLGKHVLAAMNTRNSGIVGRVYLSLLGKILVKTSPAATKNCWRHRVICRY